MHQSLVEEVPAAAAMFKRASEILGYDLLEVCVNGPKEKLDSTAVRCFAACCRALLARKALMRAHTHPQVSQPAIYVASLATLEKIKARLCTRCLLSCPVAHPRACHNR